jgi:ATP-dependent protease ClpP protease subunit
MFDDSIILLPKDPVRVFDFDVPILVRGQSTEVFLTTTIGVPCIYDELCYRLLEAGADETFTFHICTPGGDLDSAVRIIDAMRRSKATIIGDLSGSVNSAGTMITMGCDSIRCALHTSFMIHYYSASVEGRGSELKSRQDFMNRILENLMYDIYEGFLTKKEIASTVGGADFWFDHQEVMDRWEIRKTTLEKKKGKKK